MNINLHGYRGFALQRGDNSKEAILLNVLLHGDVPLVRFPNTQEIPSDLIPCGSVEWIESILGYHPVPDYYPEWVSKHLYRKVWKGDKWMLGERVFVKPSDKYKRFTGFITTDGYSKKKKPPYIFSEIVSFDNEWRYYISNGKVIETGWYSGDEINIPDAPTITGIDIPNGLCCAADFGTYNGKLCCVEVHHPFACGWYGNISTDSSTYIQWVIDGWLFMKDKESVKI